MSKSMTNDPNNPDTMSPDRLDDPADTGVLDDAELLRMLSDAYDVPAVPKTLMKRLDRGVDEMWGTSPGIATSEPGAVSRFAAQAGRRLRSLSVAASAAALVVVAVVFSSGSSSFSWAAMIEALSQQPLVTVGSEDSDAGVRWLSVADGLVGEQTATAWRLLDFRKGVVLERLANETRVRRRKADGLKRMATREKMVVALLAVPDLSDAEEILSRQLTVLNENWTDQADQVKLSVQLGDADRPDESLQLHVTLDSETQLPVRYTVTSEKLNRDVALSYPATEAAEVVSNAFPVDLPVVDAEIASDDRVAVVDNNDTIGEDIDPINPAPIAPKPEVVGVDTPPEQPTLFGAATLPWAAIERKPIPRSEIVGELDVTLTQFWSDAEIEPVSLASDVELLRRAYLDLAGRTPSVNEVRDWLADESPDRYGTLVEHLLNSRDHATHLATVWRTFLLPEGIDLSRFGGVEAFDAWLGEQFEKNVPYDELVRQLMLAEGRLTKSGPLLFYTALKLDADLLASRTARVFLGMRLECAQCHDDPFEPWTQEDFWSYAAFFARISRPQAELETVSTVMQVRDVDRGEVMYPDTEDVVMPRFLDGSTYDDSPEADARRHQLSKWLTSEGNPFFARAAANRVWAHMMGRGIVDPVDGFGERNQPVSPELLNLLASHFISSNFDLRELFRTVALSRAYQLSSGAAVADPERPEYFAQMNVKTLTAEQVYDCITVATMLANADGVAIERVGNMNREEFLQQFSTPGGKSTEYEAGIPQALTLMNGSLIGNATGLASSGLLKSLEAPFFTDDQRLEVLYLATLSRPPSTTEWELLRGYIAERDTDASVQEPLADILWALLNGAEFTMNH